MQRSIFRKVALDRLQSPEQLDQLLELTPPAGWLAFGARRPQLRGFPQHLRERLRGTQRTPRVKTPTVLQMESVECGAAALAMVLGFWGRTVPLEELRVVCGVGRDGSKASNLIKAAHGYGLKAKGYKKEPDALSALPLPFIAFWNFNHFVVVDGFDPKGVYLNDPASGKRVVSAEEFDQAFTGVVLVFAPGPEFTPGGTQPSLWAAVRQRLGGSERALLTIVVLSLLLLIPGLLIPAFARTFVDDVLIAGRTGLLTSLLLGLALTSVMRAVLLGLQESYLQRLQAKLARHAASRFVWHLLHLPIAFFTQRYAGEIGGRVALNERVARLLAGELAPTLAGAIFVVGYALLMLQYDGLLALVGIGLALLNSVALLGLGRRQADGQRRLLQDQGQFTGATYAALHAIETIKASGGESDAFVRWAGYQAKVANGEQALARAGQVASVMPSLLSMLSTGAILVIGGLRVMDGHLTVGMLVAFQSVLASFLQPLNRVATLSSTVQDVTGSINRLDDVLRYPPDRQIAQSAPLEAAEAALTTNSLPAPGTRTERRSRFPLATPPATTAQLTGKIELRNVTFGYSPMEPPLVENLNLVVQPGQRVALVGGSGSGKSTVAKLVAGLHEPWSGEILFDDVPRGELPRTAITRSLALVDQEISLFAGTVRDNLTLWDDAIPQAMVVAAAQDAAIHDEITARPGGYDSLLDEGGRDLSGGQRQRLEIARALARNPSILVLDEATSALDPLTELAVERHLRRRGCTCLIVAHRLSTIRDADEILVLDRGKVVQRGTHAALNSVPGPYADLMAADAPPATIAQPSIDAHTSNFDSMRQIWR